MYSSVRAPRSSNGMPSASNSSSQPPDAHPELDPAARQPVEGGELLGQGDRVALGEDQDAGRDADALRDRGDPGHPDQRVGDRDRVAPRHLAVGGVRVLRLVAGGHDRVLDRPERLEAVLLGQLREAGGRVGLT